MNFTTLTAPALAALLALAPAAQAINVDPGHMALGRAIASTGINLRINPGVCARRSADGWYWAARNELVVCQDNYTTANVEVEWTANDFDTLRHEAHHLIQDCLDGSRQGSIQTVYVDSPRFVVGTLDQGKIKSIIKSYSDNGATLETVRTELEAFAVAQTNDPTEQVRDINRYCF